MVKSSHIGDELKPGTQERGNDDIKSWWRLLNELEVDKAITEGITVADYTHMYNIKIT